MYARLLLFKADPSRRREVEQIADRFLPIFQEQRGLKSVHFIVSEDETEYGSFSFWESKEAADAAREVLNPRLQQELTGIATAAPERKMFEVYEPRGQ